MKQNLFVAGIFRAIAELLEIKGDNPFRIRAYLKAADNIETLKEDIGDYVRDNKVADISGIGKDLAGKIKEIVGSGRCGYYEELKKIVPASVVEMLSIPSVGPKTVKLFFDKFGIRSIESLEKAANSDLLLNAKGVKRKTLDNILKGIALLRKGKERIDLLTASNAAYEATDGLKGVKEIDTISVAGSLRRMKDTVRDIDILVSSGDPKKIIGAFLGLPVVGRILARGDTKSSVLTKNDVQLDLRVVKREEFAAGLLYFTGSKNHNIRLRSMAIKLGLKLNEYGVFDKRGRRIAVKTESDIYRLLGLDLIPPEMREDTGEIEAAALGRLPELIRSEDIKGDLHAHTNYSDGEDTVEAMSKKARGLGYGYICLTDHSISLKIAKGLDARRLKEKKNEIESANKGFKDFRILFGTEAEIDPDGNIDYSQGTLSQFDIVIGAIHSGFKQSKKQLTKRIVNACKNKNVHIIAHPTGKLWPVREPYDIDLEEVLKVARDTNTALEINAHPYRLDLSDINSRIAKEKKVRLAINTDSHSVCHLDYMKFGVGLARRAWLEKGDVLNTMPVDKLLKAVKK